MLRSFRSLPIIVAALTLAACSGQSVTPSAASLSPSDSTAGSSPSSPPTSPPTSQTSPPTSPTTTSAAVPAGGYVSAVSSEVVDNPAFDALERDILGRVSAVGLPGALLLVVHHGALVEQEAWMDYGLDTVVPIASGSKWLTAATIMTLVDEGLIGLDEPLSTYAPAARGQARTITMRQLLSFTSGLTADERVPCAEDPTTTLQQCAREFVARGVVHPPGESFRYGSQHMLVAAAVAEIVTDKPFVELFDERIAKPLAMARTGFFQAGSGGQRDNVDHPVPAGSGYSSLGDYGRFLEMIAHDGIAPNGTRILSSSAIAEMQKNQIEGAKYATASPFRVGLESPYGLGEWIDWTDARGNALVLSSDGAFGFRPWIDKRNDLFGVYLIADRGNGYVDGDPNAPADDGGKVHTSGLWVFTESAAAVGGNLPAEYYPDR